MTGQTDCTRIANVIASAALDSRLPAPFGVSVDIVAVVTSKGDAMSVSVHVPDDAETSTDLLDALGKLQEALQITRDRLEYLQR